MPKADKAKQPHAPSPEAADYIRVRLAVLNDVFTAAAVGDFSKNVDIPNQDDEFTELLVGVQMMIDVIREKITELAGLNVQLEARVKKRTAELATQEKDLEASESYVSQLLNAAPDAIIVVDDAGKITRLNHQAETIFKYTPKELIGQKIERLIPERFSTGHVGHRSSYMKEPHTRPMGVGLDLYAKRKDGSEFPVEISLSPVKRGDETSVIAIIRDISNRKRIETELKERADELEKFNQLMVGRELKMIELKRQLEALQEKHEDHS